MRLRVGIFVHEVEAVHFGDLRLRGQVLLPITRTSVRGSEGDIDVKAIQGRIIWQSFSLEDGRISTWYTQTL